MTNDSLYKRLRRFGTLTESPNDIPDAVFALPSTIHWIRALAILVDDRAVTFQSARIFYGKVQKREMDDRTLNTVCEQLLFAFHQLAALRALSAVSSKADVARLAIVTWYYGIYGAASAMVAAADGSFQNNHTATAQQWDAQFPSRGLAMAPFADRLPTVLKDDVANGLVSVRARGKHPLTNVNRRPNGTHYRRAKGNHLAVWRWVDAWRAFRAGAGVGRAEPDRRRRQREVGFPCGLSCGS